MKIPTEYLPLVQAYMYDHNVLGGDLSLMAGWVHAESAWDQHAMRYEPAFRRIYVDPIPNLSETERVARSTSWGMLQIMGQVAREHGFDGKYLPALCDPHTNIDMACKILRERFHVDNQWDGALARYNGGIYGNRRAPYRNEWYVRRVHEYADMYR